MAQKANQNIVPANLIGILPLQEAVLFPHTVIPLAVVKKPGIALVEEALREGKPIGLTVLKDREVEEPGPDDVHRVGTIGVIQKMLKVPDGTLRCIVAGQQVFNIEKFTQVSPYMVAAYTELPDSTVENEELVAMQRNLAGLFQKLLSYLPQAPARWRWRSRTSPIRWCLRTSSHRRCAWKPPIVRRCSRNATRQNACAG